MGERTDGQTALRASRLSLCGNLILTLIKLCAALAARSTALLSETVHSLSDTGSSLIVVLGVKLSGKGKGRAENAAALLLSGVLCVTGLMLGENAIRLLRQRSDIPVPGAAAPAAAAVSVFVKELLYRYTRRCAEKTGSPALMAEARHHRSDEFCALGVLTGVFAARHGCPRLDGAVGLGIASAILCSALLISRDVICRQRKKH